MNKRGIGLALFCVALIVPWRRLLADSYAVSEKSCERKLQVIRQYKIAVNPGKISIAALPAVLSFWGETNWQIVKSSKFEYSELPDSVIITADSGSIPASDRGRPCRYYRMTWNAPKAATISVKQAMELELTCFGTLYTSAKLPYPEEVRQRFTQSLGADAQINPHNPELGPICDAIVKKSHSAEDVVEGVCDWINENVTFEDGQRTSDEALAQRRGSCTPMSRLACAMLRRIGMPAERVPAKFIGGDNSHTFIEVYFPDAGWIFYDLSNWNRGFKSLECVALVGWGGYYSGTPENLKCTGGNFCSEKDVAPFKDLSDAGLKLIRRAPPGREKATDPSGNVKELKILCATVVQQKPPASVRPRQRPLRELILDLAVPPGPRDYTDDVIGKASVPDHL